MPVDKQVMLRYQVLNKCFRNRYREYTIDGLTLYDICLTQKEICQLQDIPYEEKEYPTTFVNGDFEGSYAPLANSGVTSDRAIYVPEGWTVDYGTRDPNDFTALKDGDLLYGQFFAAKPQNSNGGEHTLWMRQRWGASIINFFQEVKLAEGSYHLSADLFATDNSSNNTATVYVGGIARSVTATNQWQTVSIDFEADGTPPSPSVPRPTIKATSSSVPSTTSCSPRRSPWASSQGSRVKGQ